MIILETERLRLRTWKESDKTPYFQLNQDPKVTEFLPRSITQDEATHFLHPKLATTHPLAPHVLYKATQERVIHVKLFAVI